MSLMDMCMHVLSNLICSIDPLHDLFPSTLAVQAAEPPKQKQRKNKKEKKLARSILASISVAVRTQSCVAFWANRFLFSNQLLPDLSFPTPSRRGGRRQDT